MKKRWISLYVENEVGVLAKIAGLFSGKSYNLTSLTVGTTEDPTMSRMTISVESDDATMQYPFFPRFLARYSAWSARLKSSL